MADAVGFQVADEAWRNNYFKTLEREGLFAVVTADVVDKWDQSNLKEIVFQQCKALVEGGVSTFEVTCRLWKWLEIAGYVVEAAKKIEGLVPAVGTHANLFTLHQAMQAGVKVHVASHGFPRLAGRYAVVPEQEDLINPVETYISAVYLDQFTRSLGLRPAEKQRLHDFPLEMDPIAYALARGAVAIGSFVTSTEYHDLLLRGAFFGQKAFNFEEKTPPLWNKQFAAVAYVYHQFMNLCATGGIKADSLELVLKTKVQKETKDDPPRFIMTAGASALVGATPEETYNNAKQYRGIVDAVRGSQQVRAIPAYPSFPLR